MKCPQCGSDWIAEILYGFPDFNNEQFQQDHASGKIALGGCVVMEGVEQPTRRCNDCNHEWYVAADSPDSSDSQAGSPPMQSK